MNTTHREPGTAPLTVGSRSLFLAALLAAPVLGTSIASASVPACGNGIVAGAAHLHAECTSAQALMPDSSSGVANTIHGAILVEREPGASNAGESFQTQEQLSEQSANKSALVQRAVETRAVAYLSRLDAKASGIGCADATPRDVKYTYTNLMAERHALSETQRLRLLNAMNTSADTNTGCD